MFLIGIHGYVKVMIQSACVANLNAETAHIHIWQSRNLSMYQNCNKTDNITLKKVRVLGNLYQSANGFQVSLREIMEFVKPSSIDKNMDCQFF